VEIGRQGQGLGTQMMQALCTELDGAGQVDRLSAVQSLDLLGTGTACLVWSSPLSGESRAPLLYVDPMGGQKPHLLVLTRNNLGAETRITYAPSTRSYLTDKASDRPATEVPTTTLAVTAGR
jgi:hypothetical protein